MVGEVETILMGIIGVVIGGIIVKIFSIKYQKRIERKEEEEKSKIKYKRAIKAKLTELIDTWNKEWAKDYIDQTEIQNEFDIYSKQLTSIVSIAPDDFSEDIIEELRELSASLRKIKDSDFFFAMGYYESSKKECQEIIKKAEVIREKLE